MRAYIIDFCLITVTFFLLSCGERRQDAELLAWVESCGRQLDVNYMYVLGIEFDEDMDNGIAAQCYYGKKIVINKDHWLRITDIQKEILMFHELGHCNYFRKHNDELLQDGQPESLMHKDALKALSIDYYLENKDYYLNELKER